MQEDLGMQVFDNGGSPTQDMDQFDASWKIKDEFIGIMRATVSSMGSGDPQDQSKQLNKSLDRVIYKKVEGNSDPARE